MTGVHKMGMAERREALALGPRLCAAREDIEAMTFVAVEGWCVGVGTALAVAFDVRVAGEGLENNLYLP